jgi:tetratricopeptide (TPR) repeat protein
MLMFSGAMRFSRNTVSFAVAMTVGLLLLVGCRSDEDRLASFLERGNQYIDNDEPEEAIIEFKNVLQIEPEHAAAHEALSLAYLKVEKPREAYWEMSETVRLDPQNVDARLRYGTVSAAIGDYDLSLEQAEAVLELDPTNAAALILRGQSRETRDDLEGAEADFRAAVENEPDGPAYRLLLTGFFERQRRFDEGEQALRDLIEIEESYLAVSTLARMVVRSGDRDDEALKLLERSIELAKVAPTEIPEPGPDGDPRTTSLAANVLREPAIQAAYGLLSAFHYDRGRFEKAIEALEEGVANSETKTELIYQMARVYRLKGMTDEQDRMIRRATEEAPESASAQLVLSAYLGQRGDTAGALEAARAAVAINPKALRAQLREAELLVDLGYQESDPGTVQAGAAIVDRVLAEQPEFPEANFVRAKIELADQDFEAAKASLESVLLARPGWAKARFVLGSVLAATNELSRARVELARAVEIDPQLFAAKKLLAKLHSQLGEDEFAIEQGREYLVENSDDSEVRIIVGQSLIRVGRPEEAYLEVEKIPEDQRDAAAYFALGRLDLAAGRTELGTERLRKADELAPGNPQVLRTLLAIDRTNDDLDASVARIERAVAANPEASEIAEIDAEVKGLKGDLEGARASLERAIELDSRNVSAQLTLANLEAHAGNVEAAISVMERAAAAAPESPDLQYRLALIYENNGRRADAIDAYEKSISLNGDLAMAKNNLAYLLAESGGDLDRALELAQQAKEQLPDDASAADTLGWILVKRGVPSAAIGYLEEAAERFPTDAFEVQGIVRNHLAEAYELNKEAEKAINESHKSVDQFQQLTKLAKERGDKLDEPDWSREARERIDRLSASS